MKCNFGLENSFLKISYFHTLCRRKFSGISISGLLIERRKVLGLTFLRNDYILYAKIKTCILKDCNCLSIVLQKDLSTYFNKLLSFSNINFTHKGVSYNKSIFISLNEKKNYSFFDPSVKHG